MVGVLWWGWAAERFNSGAGGLLLWCALFLSGGCIIYGAWLRATESYLVALVGLYMFGSIPLLENSIGLSGYSESVIGIICMAIVIVIFRFHDESKIISIFTLSILLIACFFIKNISYVYGFSIVISAALAGIFGGIIRVMAVAFLAAACLLAVIGFHFDLGPASVEWNPYQLTLYAGKKLMTFYTFDAESVNLMLDILNRALIVNSSFSIIWLFFLARMA